MGMSLVLFSHLYLLFFCLVYLESSDLPASVSLAIFHLQSTRAVKSPGHELSSTLFSIPYEKRKRPYLTWACKCYCSMSERTVSYYYSGELKYLSLWWVKCAKQKKENRKSHIIPYYLYYYIKSSKMNGTAFSLNHCLTLQVYLITSKPKGWVLVLIKLLLPIFIQSWPKWFKGDLEWPRHSNNFLLTSSRINPNFKSQRKETWSLYVYILYTQRSKINHFKFLFQELKNLSQPVELMKAIPI